MDDHCDLCKASSYLDKSFKCKKVPCGHSFCDTCLNKIFEQVPAFCPRCQKPMRKGDISTAAFLFDDPVLQNEIKAREKLSKIFTLIRDDFENEKEYNDYLERIEDYVFNIANNYNTQSTWESIKRFEQRNGIRITQRLHEKELSARKLAEEFMQKQIEKEKNLREYYVSELRILEEKEKNRKEKMDNVSKNTISLFSSVGKDVTLPFSSNGGQTNSSTISSSSSSSSSSSPSLFAPKPSSSSSFFEPLPTEYIIRSLLGSGAEASLTHPLHPDRTEVDYSKAKMFKQVLNQIEKKDVERMKNRRRGEEVDLLELQKANEKSKMGGGYLEEVGELRGVDEYMSSLYTIEPMQRRKKKRRREEMDASIDNGKK